MERFLHFLFGSKHSIVEESKGTRFLLRRNGIALLLLLAIFTSCVTQRGTIQIQDYVLLPNGKQTLGHNQGLTAFVFENNPRKMPFVQFVSDKYRVGVYQDVSYKATIDGHTFTVYVYDSAELNKYFDMSPYMVTLNETEPNIVGSAEKFIGLSVVDDHNEDCLIDASLYQNIVVKYLLSLKDEYYNL